MSNAEVISHYYFLRDSLVANNQKFLTVVLGLNNFKNGTVNDVANVWEKASLPIVSKNRIQTKLKNTITKFDAARRRARLKNKGVVEEEWMFLLFDVPFKMGHHS